MGIGVASIAENAENAREEGVLAPLKHGVFRRIWLASFASNFGMLIQGVGAAWAMAQLSGSPDMVAMVVTASFIPSMLLSLASGAMADMYDRRLICIIALSICLSAAAALTAFTFLGLITPIGLLIFCFIIGVGGALIGPSWQASVSEQVPARILPQAISLNSISFNIARSFGPAIGGALVAAAGVVAAFLANTLLYIPMIVVLFLWRRVREVPRLPPESLGRAMISGVRYVMHSPPIRAVLLRTLLLGLVGGAMSALMPLVARDLVGGGAFTFGILLGTFGMGAVLGALNMAAIRARFDNEAIIPACMVAMGVSAVGVSVSSHLFLSAGALIAFGAAWTVSVACYNIEIQLAVPRWVAGRTLAIFQAAIAGGVAVCGILWGHVAEYWSVQIALIASGVAMFVLALVWLWQRMPRSSGAVENSEELSEPETALALTARSGPIIIEIEYRVDPSNARLFYDLILEVQRTRQRNGAYGWSIARDIAAPDLWVERFECPTWNDYLRQRSRSTQAERELQLRLIEYHAGDAPVRVRRLLERPFGSVRWREDTPDPAHGAEAPITGPGGPLG